MNSITPRLASLQVRNNLHCLYVLQIIPQLESLRVAFKYFKPAGESSFYEYFVSSPSHCNKLLISGRPTSSCWTRVYIKKGLATMASFQVAAGCLMLASLQVAAGSLMLTSLRVAAGSLILTSLQVAAGCLLLASLQVFAGCPILASLQVAAGCPMLGQPPGSCWLSNAGQPPGSS